MEITLEQVERLRARANVSYTQAKAALEHTDGDLLEAILYLEQQGQTAPPQQGGAYATQTREESREALHEAISASSQDRGRSGAEQVMDFVLGLLHKGIANQLTVSHGGRTVTSIPLVILPLLLVVAFWVTLPLLALSFVLGCRFSLTGPDVERESVEQVMEDINTGADTARRQAGDLLSRYHEKFRRRKGGK